MRVTNRQRGIMAPMEIAPTFRIGWWRAWRKKDSTISVTALSLSLIIQNDTAEKCSAKYKILSYSDSTALHSQLYKDEVLRDMHHPRD